MHLFAYILIFIGLNKPSSLRCLGGNLPPVCLLSELLEVGVGGSLLRSFGTTIDFSLILKLGVLLLELQKLSLLLYTARSSCLNRAID